MKLYLVVFLAFCFPPFGHAADTARPSGQDRSAYFTTSFRSDWWMQEVPKESLQLFSQQVRKMTGQDAGYLTAYATSRPHNEFTVPFITVTLRENGKIPEDAAQAIKSKDFQDRFDQAPTPGIKDAKFGETFFDYQNKIIWTGMIAHPKPQVELHATQAMMLTETGILSFTLYTAAGDAESEAKFKTFIKLVTINPRLQYRHVVSWQESLFSAFMGGIGLGILFGILSFSVFVCRFIWNWISKRKTLAH